jgi:transcriptional regulator with XRE-family HTH domain
MAPSSTLDLPSLRAKLGLTQLQLAHALGVSVRTVRRWEQGAPVHLIWQERLTAMYRKHQQYHEEGEVSG